MSRPEAQARRGGDALLAKRGTAISLLRRCHVTLFLEKRIIKIIKSSVLARKRLRAMKSNARDNARHRTRHQNATALALSHLIMPCSPM